MNGACCRNLGPLFYFIHLCSSLFVLEGGTPSILRLGISQPDGQSKNNLLSPCPPPWRPKMSSFSNLVSDGRDGAVLGVCSASTSTRQLSSSDKKKWTTDERARRRRIGGGAISPVDKSLLSSSALFAHSALSFDFSASPSIYGPSPRRGEETIHRMKGMGGRQRVSFMS